MFASDGPDAAGKLTVVDVIVAHQKRLDFLTFEARVCDETRDGHMAVLDVLCKRANQNTNDVICCQTRISHLEKEIATLARQTDETIKELDQRLTALENQAARAQQRGLAARLAALERTVADYEKVDDRNGERLLRLECKYKVLLEILAANLTEEVRTEFVRLLGFSENQ